MNKQLVTILDFEIELSRRLKDSYRSHPNKSPEKYMAILDTPYLNINYVKPSKLEKERK